ncbi:MAG: flagellar assembly protein FliW [candidate division Zixibacteria bacterium]|nr:flagellar assembly protein FliW [candidate division Zixibacteria bacterium]
MIVDSLRFGSLQVPDEKLIIMERSILGFEALTEFCLIEVNELAPFLWLQSTENSAVAFLVVNPSVFFPDYRVEVNSREIAELGVIKASSIETYTIVTVSDDPRQISVNLQGPILINTENNLAKQLVLVNSKYQVRHSLFDTLEKDSANLYRREELVGA